MKKLNTIARAVAKALEILHWSGVAVFAALLVASLAAGDWLRGFLTQNIPEFAGSMSTYGFELSAVQPDGALSTAAVSLFSGGTVIILSLMAMVFRNVSLIFRTAQGKTWFSQGGTPFQKNIVRMVREIGVFYLAVPVVGLLLSAAARLMLGPDACEIMVNVEGLVTGLLLLCLSQVFAYGMQLEQDVDGLV